MDQRALKDLVVDSRLKYNNLVDHSKLLDKLKAETGITKKNKIHTLLMELASNRCALCACVFLSFCNRFDENF